MTSLDFDKLKVPDDLKSDVMEGYCESDFFALRGFFEGVSVAVFMQMPEIDSDSERRQAEITLASRAFEKVRDDGLGNRALSLIAEHFPKQYGITAPKLRQERIDAPDVQHELPTQSL